MASETQISMLQALENFNAIVDAETLGELEVTEEGQILSHHGSGEEEKQTEGELYWVEAGIDEATLETLNGSYQSVYQYLEGLYKRVGSQNPKMFVDGVNTIMVLVGEATNKLERMDPRFKEKITHFDTFKKLQAFYHEHVVEEGYEKLERQVTPPKEEVEEEKLLLDDLDRVRGDREYELFYLRDASGKLFYTFDLARNIKLAVDWGEQIFVEDPLVQVKNWEDKRLHIFAKEILETNKRLIDRFYKQAMKFRSMEMINHVNQALMALMLAANPRNLLRQFSLKGAYAYFHDFQSFLRNVLESREFQKYLLYSSPESQPFFLDVLVLVQSLCMSLFHGNAENHEIRQALDAFCPKGSQEPLSRFLEKSYVALTEALKQHPDGPVFKAMDFLMEVEEEESVRFDPLMQGNLPDFEGKIAIGDRETEVTRMPSPTHQENISSAEITADFVEYLRGYIRKNKTSLLVNFQDRTSWKEHARAKALEELSRQAEFVDTLFVATLAKDTDFYHQTGPYGQLNDAGEFMKHFAEHLADESTGYFFPKGLHLEIFPTWIASILQLVHKHYFHGRNRLGRRDRIDFIELTYLFIELKMIELLKPNTLTHTSKDGLDLSGVGSVGLIALLGSLQGKSWSEQERSELVYILFGPTLVQRERAIFVERFSRLLHILELLEEHEESSQGILEELGKLFEKETLKARLLFGIDK